MLPSFVSITLTLSFFSQCHLARRPVVLPYLPASFFLPSEFIRPGPSSPYLNTTSSPLNDIFSSRPRKFCLLFFHFCPLSSSISSLLARLSFLKHRGSPKTLWRGPLIVISPPLFFVVVGTMKIFPLSGSSGCPRCVQALIFAHSFFLLHITANTRLRRRRLLGPSLVFSLSEVCCFTGQFSQYSTVFFLPDQREELFAVVPTTV